MRKAAFAAVVAALGCSHYEMKSAWAEGTNLRLPHSSSWFIALPKDGRYGNRFYHGSGTLTAESIERALSPYASSVRLAEAVASLEKNVESARGASADFIIHPTILHWEHRVLWANRVSVGLQIIEVSTSEILDTSIVKATSGVVVFPGFRPEDLLPELMQRYMGSLFGSSDWARPNKRLQLTAAGGGVLG